MGLHTVLISIVYLIGTQMNLDDAIIFDIEIFPNVFTLSMEHLRSDTCATWEISEFRDDRKELIKWFNYLFQNQIPMIGFNNINFDYPVIHMIMNNPRCSIDQIYQKAIGIINSQDRFSHIIWPNDRFAAQIDMFKIYHFDNPAKSTNLKSLQINMRSPSVVDMPVAVGSKLTKEQIDNLLIPYNQHDVQETKKFVLHSTDALNYRLSLVEKFGVDVMNWPDTKIGSKTLESRLPENLLYEWRDGKKKTRQTIRTQIAIKDIIFPFIKFENPEFQRILDYLRGQVLTTGEINQFSDSTPRVQTKGVFTSLKAHINGLDFYFGTGGIHGSISSQRIIANDEWLIRDIDVAALYPSIAIVNNLSPLHLGEAFTEIYSQLPEERKKWQKNKGKKCIEANTLKLASNGVYGNSNNPYSVFLDSQFTITITINGQLMLCMLAERLMKIPSLKILQINTDGITYFIHKSQEPLATELCREWENITKLVLEDADYSRIFIRDCNNYVAESLNGSLKLKGAYWYPDPLDYINSISAAQPPAWHKNLSNLVSIQAAVAAMIHGINPEDFVHANTNPYDFCCRVKVNRSDKLYHGTTEMQRNTRYYMCNDGAELMKISPPAGQPGMFKRKNGISEHEYQTMMSQTNGAWDERVCTKNRSRYEERRTSVVAGYKTAICNDIADFDFNNLNYGWYVSEAHKLIIN